MEYQFTAFGHKNITGKHKNTLEFTKGSELRIQGDCILGVKSDFNLEDLKKMVSLGKSIKIVISSDGISDEVVFEPNPDFDDGHEIVIRKSDFNSKRTFGIRADKACSDLKKKLVESLNKKDIEIKVYLITIK